jgi:hypothetical protein
LRAVLPLIRDAVQILQQRDPCSVAMHAEIYVGVHLLRMAVPHLERAIEHTTP